MGVMRFVLLLLFISVCSAAITHVGSPTANCSKSSNPVAASGSFTFTCTANATGNAVVFAINCSAGVISAVSLTASGWTITALSPLQGNDAQGHAASFGAIAPNTSGTTFTATFTGATNCGGFTIAQTDEFTGNDKTGGTRTFEARSQSNGASSPCPSTPVTPINNNDAIWFACIDSPTGVNGGYTKGQDDTFGDWTEYKILAGNAGTAQNAGFTNGGGDYNTFGVAIKPLGQSNRLPLLGVGFWIWPGIQWPDPFELFQ